MPLILQQAGLGMFSCGVRGVRARASQIVQMLFKPLLLSPLLTSPLAKANHVAEPGVTVREYHRVIVAKGVDTRGVENWGH